jgi:dTDP-4-amino-4,6-dideoxy-D-galactose acyltransferase
MSNHEEREMNNIYEILEWDSNFFGFTVCRINEPNLSNDELAEILKLLSSLQIDLVYYSKEKELTSLNSISAYYEIKLVDKKTTFAKKLNSTSVFKQNSAISEYKGNYPEKKLLELAIESGVYSRFNVDEKIGKEKYQELYSLWIINSVSKLLAKEVLVFRTANEISGFVTLGEKNERADIGIIAVDSFYRGKGIGKSLMFSAEKWFIDENYNSIQVVTQGENIPACRLYESCGYNIENVEYFYHIWKK